MSVETVSVPVGPLLSLFAPIYVGINEFGHPVYVPVIYKNLLAGSEPGGGKSTLLNNIAAHGSLSTDCRMVLLDGKLVELAMWEDVADEFVGPDIIKAITTLRRVQTVINNRYLWLTARRRKKIMPGDEMNTLLLIIDEIAYYSATTGTKQQQDEFVALLRDVVSRGRACGVVVIAATQRPNVDIIPTSLRDIFGYRFAGRCTTDNSSDLILGHGCASRGYSAASISPENPGEGFLIAEGGTPFRMKSPWMSDNQIESIVDYAAWIRRHGRDAEPDTTQELLAIPGVAA